MEQKNIIAAVVVLALIIAGMFIFAYLKKAELNQNPADQTPTATPSGDEAPFAGITRVDAKHFFDGKTHTLAGEMNMPTPCDLLNWSTRIQESMPETAIVEFDVINNAESCIQVITPQRFLVSFDASENAVIRATLKGQEIDVNLIPALPGETPEDFELFIKG
jgi:hypothetical protein